MGLYTNMNHSFEEEEMVDVNMDELLEAFFYDDHYSDSDYEKQQLLENMSYLEESVAKKHKISRKTVVKLNKNDDLARRTTMANMQVAKDKGDPLWKQLVAVRVKERKLLGLINKKYTSVGQKIAKIAQRDYMKGDQNVKSMTPKELASTRV